MGFWNDIERLQLIAVTLKYSTILLIFLSGFLSLGSHITDSRSKKLMAIRNAEKEVVQTKRDKENEDRIRELTKATAGRTLTADTRLQMVQLLKNIISPLRIHIEYQLGNPESKAFANEIRSIFEDVGWNPGVIDEVQTFPSVENLLVKLKTDTQPEEFAKFLYLLGDVSGAKIQARILPDLPYDCGISVGYKAKG